MDCLRFCGHNGDYIFLGKFQNLITWEEINTFIMVGMRKLQQISCQL